MKEYIQKVVEGNHLTKNESSDAMRYIMEGNATDAQIAGFLIALKTKGEHPDEVLGFVEVMREKSVKIQIEDPDAIDMCGTGGDGSGTFNISTVASFVVAGTGMTVAKHGNRSISSSCGSADVLTALGVNINLSPEHVERCVNTIGIGFLFAPLFHPAMKYAAGPRAELGVKTCFNILGPLTNPGNVKRQLVGAFDQPTAKIMAEVFTKFRPAKVCVVHSADGLDEVSLGAQTSVYEVNGTSSVAKYTIQPSELALSHVQKEMVPGGTVEFNASIAMRVLEGEQSPYRDMVVINAAFGLYVGGKIATLKEGIALAAEAIDSRNALKKLHQLKEFSNT
jgi:anthranilate phosphoribosyltransferase